MGDFTSNLEGKARSDGFDIRFTENDGFTLLDHEVQDYSEANDQFTAWVKVDLTGADQTIYAYYGKPSASSDPSTTDVWSNGFRAVWHLEEDPNGDPTDGIIDDSGFGNHGTPNGTMTTADLVSGQIGNGLDLDGGDDYINVVNSSSLQIVDNTITLSAWVNISPSIDNDEGFILKGANNDESYLLGTGTASELARMRINDSGNQTQAGSIPTTDTWHHIVGVYDGSNRIIYLDGSQTGISGAFSTNIEHDPLDPIYLGRRADNGAGRFYEGRMDELRISDTPRDANWITTEFNSEGSPSTFIALGTEEQCNPIPSGGTATATDEFILTGNNTTITLTGNTTGTINWQESTDNITFMNVTGGSGDGTPTYTTPNLTQTTFYRALISNTTACVKDVVSSTAKVNVIPAYGQGNYASRKRITIDATQVCGASALSNFPILFTTTDNDLRTIANSGQVENSNGYDIIFTSSDGATLLDHQLESYNATTGEVNFWVRVPSLSNSTDTEIFIYFGDPTVAADQSSTSTWDANYAGVWHMDATLEDGTSNNQDGTNSGTTDVEGFIARGRNFDGVNDQVIVPHVASSSLDITGNQVTLEAWVKAPANTNDTPFLIKAPATNFERYMLGIDGATNQVNTRVTTSGGHFRDDSGPINVDDWTHVVFVYDGSLGANPRKFLYVNGTQIDTYNANGNILTTTSDMVMGKRFDNRWFEGDLDELRVSDNVRSSDWICTEFNNQDSPPLLTFSRLPSIPPDWRKSQVSSLVAVPQHFPNMRSSPVSSGFIQACTVTPVQASSLIGLSLMRSLVPSKSWAKANFPVV